MPNTNGESRSHGAQHVTRFDCQETDIPVTGEHVGMDLEREVANAIIRIANVAELPTDEALVFVLVRKPKPEMDRYVDFVRAQGPPRELYRALTHFLRTLERDAPR